MKRDLLKKVPWRDILLVGLLILLDISIHPLTGGPDRLVHDPAVYRLWDPNYLSGDWYTGMAVKSGVYIFYAQLIGLGPLLGIPEELWRLLLYIASLSVLYYALIRIARLFTKNILVVPMLVLLHAFINTGDNQPLWLYGPFVQIDGGLAPRSIGVAASFLALFFLMRKSIILPALLLGLATLIHVSNSLIVFTLFFLVWIIVSFVRSWPLDKQTRIELIQKGIQAVIVYLICGGWYALYAASQGTHGISGFPTAKFIWAWIYFRAPYMALPLAGKYWWIRLFAHAASIVIGWIMLRKRVANGLRNAVDILALVGLGSIGYFFLFYLFAFIWPWLPGFQFYSLRVVYLGYFVAYLFISVVFLMVAYETIIKLFLRLRIKHNEHVMTLVVGLITGALLIAFASRLGNTFRKPQWRNVQISWYRLLDSSALFPSSVPQNQKITRPHSSTLDYLFTHPEPFLAPPNLRTSIYYLPNVASFKSFGFTEEGLAEWYTRMNDVSRGEVQRAYEAYVRSGQAVPVTIEWNKIYPELTAEEIVNLSRKYNFKLFLANRSNTYPFEQIAEDHDYRLYKLP